MTADLPRFRTELGRLGTVVLDTNVLIYHLEGLVQYTDLTAALVASLAEGDLEGIVSTVTLAELLAGPYRDGEPEKADAARSFVEGLPNTRLGDVTPEIADRAAWLRPRGFRMPDALILATAMVHSADAVVTNDPDLRHRIRGLPGPIVLDDFLTSD